MIRKRRTSICIALAMTVMLLAACSSTQQNQTRSAADDALIVAQVRARLAAVDPVTMTLVHVTIDNGTITLSGKIASAKERSTIEAAARGVNGVSTVVDKVVVDPAAPTGEQITADLELSGRIRSALVAQTGVNAARIHVDVHRGVVTLSGTLPSAAHRAVADETVRNIPGVVKLIDDIAIAQR
jgi:hyperosmotically inducible protein